MKDSTIRQAIEMVHNVTGCDSADFVQATSDCPTQLAAAQAQITQLSAALTTCQSNYAAAQAQDAADKATIQALQNKIAAAQAALK